MNRSYDTPCFALAVLAVLFVSGCGGPSEMTPEQAKDALFNGDVPVAATENELFRRVEMEDGEVVRLLLQAGLSVDGEKDAPPLYAAVRNSSAAMTQLLLDRGANPNLEAGKGGKESLLSVAAGLANIEIVRLLLDHGADPNGLDIDWRPPIFHAIERNGLDAVRLLLDRGAKTDVVYGGVETVLTMAARHTLSAGASTELFDSLWATNADPTKGALVYEVASAPDGVFEKVAASGADINRPGEQGFTALMRAAGERTPARVRRLIELGADVNALDEDGRTALWHAAWAGSGKERRDTFQALLDAGAKTDVTDKGGKRLVDQLAGDLRSLVPAR